MRLFGRLVLGGAAAVAVVAARPEAHAAEPPKRPNIVLVIGDDMSWHDSEPYGSKDVPTPNMARLAREGMTFDKAFQSTAMCAVTRHQLYTGLDPMRNGAYPQHSWSTPGVKSVFGYLKDAGYRVGLTGKTHVGPPENFPWEFLGDAAGAQGGVDENLPLVDLKAVEAFVARDKGQPFFVVVASHNPHAPWTQGDASKFDPAKIHVPPYLVDTPAMRTALVSYYAEITALDAELGEVMAILDRQGAAKDTLIVFTSEQGNSVPFAKWTLYDPGLKTDLIVRWPGHVKAGTRTDALAGYEDITPTFIAAAGATPPKTLDGRSLTPVLTGKAAGVRDYLYGIHTNLGIIGGEPYPIRSVRDGRYTLVRNLTPDEPYKNVINNTKAGYRVLKDWQAAADAGNAQAAARIAAYDKRPAVELFDREADPFDLVNRADDPALAGVRARLEAELDRWMAHQGDTGLPKEMEAFRHINPAIVRWINENYPDAARNPDGTKVNR
jgi:uncharacterized sulfatase